MMPCAGQKQKVEQDETVSGLERFFLNRQTNLFELVHHLKLVLTFSFIKSSLNKKLGQRVVLLANQLMNEGKTFTEKSFLSSFNQFKEDIHNFLGVFIVVAPFSKGQKFFFLKFVVRLWIQPILTIGFENGVA